MLVLSLVRAIFGGGSSGNAGEQFLGTVAVSSLATQAGYFVPFVGARQLVVAYGREE